MERSCWALSVMMIASFITFLETLLIYSNAIKPEVKEVIDLSKYSGLDLVMAEKMTEVLTNFAADFASGIQNDALVMLIISGVALIAIVGWGIYQQRASSLTEEQC